MKKVKVDKPKFVSIKVGVEVVELVREHKKKTRTPVGAFFELAAMEKLKRESK